MKKLNEAGRQFIESLFDYTVMDRQTEHSGGLRFIGEALNGKAGHEDDYRVFMYTHMKSMRNKYGYHLGYGDEFTGVYATALTQATAALGDRFPDFNEFINNKKTQLSTMKYIKTELKKILYMQANPDTFQTRNGRQNVFIHNEVQSLEALKAHYEDGEREMEVGEAANVFGRDIEEDYYFTYYIQHFLKNKARVMTKKQYDFYEALKDAYVPQNAEVTKQAAFEAVGYTVTEVNKYKVSIQKRMQRDFEQFGQKHSLSCDARAHIIKVMHQFLRTAESDDNLRNMKLNLTRIIQDNYEIEDFETTITKGLGTEDKQAIVRTVKGTGGLTNALLYHIHSNIEDYVHNHAPVNITPSDIHSTYTEGIFHPGQKGHTHIHYRIQPNGTVHAVDFNEGVDAS